jgi:hypothetical protein
MKRRALIILVGGASFWGPTTIIELLTKNELNLVLASILPPAMLLLCYFLFRKNRLHWERSISLWMLLGIYMLGSLFICVGATRHGGGFSQISWIELPILIIILIVPFFTFWLSFESGTYGLALVTGTILMLMLHFRLERKRTDAKRL